MVVWPVPCSVASPAVTPVKTATLWLEEVKLVSEVTFAPLLVAVNCSEPVDKLTVGLLGERTRALVLVPTVKVAEPLTVPSVAVMVAVPAFTPLARPPVEMVATVVSELLQTRLCKEPVVPSLFTPVAVNCWVAPTATEPVAGVTLMEDKVGLTKNPLQDTPASATRTTSASSGSTRLFDISQDSTPRWAISFNCQWSRCPHSSKSDATPWVTAGAPLSAPGHGDREKGQGLRPVPWTENAGKGASLRDKRAKPGAWAWPGGCGRQWACGRRSPPVPRASG